MNDSGLPRGFNWEEAEDITALSEGALRGRLEAFFEVERALSYSWRLLQGRINLIRAKLVGWGAVGLSSEDLARVLTGDVLEGRG